MVRAGDFRKPVQLSKGTVGWPVAVVEAWLGGRTEDSFAKLKRLAVTNPADLSPEELYRSAVSVAADVVKHATGQAPDHVVFARNATDAEMQHFRDAATESTATWLRPFDGMTDAEARVAASVTFNHLRPWLADTIKTSQPLPAADDLAGRMSWLAEMMGRAVERLKPLPGLPRHRRQT